MLALLAAVVIATPAVGSGVATAEPKPAWDSIVIATGNPAVDPAAVQAAVDAGGNVLLKGGTFDFGANGRVMVTTDGVTISGEVDDRGNHRTVVVGGNIPFSVGSSLPAPAVPLFGDPTVAPVRDVTITNLALDGPTAVGIGVWASSGVLTISGNRITGGTGGDFFGGYIGAGVAVTTFNLLSPTVVDPSNVTGTVVIEDNVVDGEFRVSGFPFPGSVPHPTVAGVWVGGLTWGIQIGHLEATGTIDGNVIGAVGDYGVFLENQFPVASAAMVVQVTRNTISPGTEGAGLFLGNGIGNLGVSGAYVAHNDVVATNPSADGIFSLLADNVVITKNDVTVQNSAFGAITLYDDSFGAYIGQNKIRGSGTAGLLVSPQSPSLAEHNTYVGNNTSRFTPDPTAFGLASHYVLLPGANGNLIVGAGNATVLDFGADNVITGVTPVAGQVGEQMADAQHRKQETIKLFGP